MPLDVRRTFMLLPSRLRNLYAVETGRPPNAHRSRPDPASRLRKAFGTPGLWRHSGTLAHSNELTPESEVLLVGTRERRAGLVLAFPVLDRGSEPREHDVFVLDARENLAGVEVLDDFATIIEESMSTRTGESVRLLI
jgi:hypothetical protein